MNTNTTLYTKDKQARKQRVFVCLLLLPFVLFTLSGFTFIPKTVQTPNQAIRPPIPLTLQMSTTLTLSAAEESCIESIYVVQFSLSGIKINFNVCALEHLSALVQSAGAGGAFIGLFSSLWC